MWTVVRHLLSILMLPFVAVVVVPYGLLHANVGAERGARDGSAVAWLLSVVGVILFAAGLALFSWCVVLFAKVGRGTLAPWDPTRDLVAIGPYRFVRNPMISGVALLLIGQALLWKFLPIGIWAVVFIVINHVYFLLIEEPGLERRLGEPYRAYKANVPRWIPRSR
jgi:protein-S-isoprenylcysteine O-methyltransferase Ste14